MCEIKLSLYNTPNKWIRKKKTEQEGRMFLEPGGFIVVMVVVAGGRMMTKTVLIFRTEAPLHCIINISHTQMSLRHPPHPHGVSERAHTRHLFKFSEKKKSAVCLS